MFGRKKKAETVIPAPVTTAPSEHRKEDRADLREAIDEIINTFAAFHEEKDRHQKIMKRHAWEQAFIEALALVRTIQEIERLKHWVPPEGTGAHGRMVKKIRELMAHQK